MAVTETCKITHSSQYRNTAAPTPPTHASTSTGLIPPTADPAAWAIVKEYVVADEMSLPEVEEKLKTYLGPRY
jgi:hypothetical protein